MPGLGPTVKPTNHLISKVCALGNGFEIVVVTFIEACIGVSVAIIVGGAEVPLGGGNTLKTATELCQIVWVILVVLVPLHKEFCLKVWYGVSQCILWSKNAFVQHSIAGHLLSVAIGPFDLDGWQLAQTISNPALGLPGFIKLNPLGIPAERRIIKC